MRVPALARVEEHTIITGALDDLIGVCTLKTQAPEILNRAVPGVTGLAGIIRQVGRIVRVKDDIYPHLLAHVPVAKAVHPTIMISRRRTCLIGHLQVMADVGGDGRNRVLTISDVQRKRRCRRVLRILERRAVHRREGLPAIRPMRGNVELERNNLPDQAVSNRRDCQVCLLRVLVDQEIIGAIHAVPERLPSKRECVVPARMGLAQFGRVNNYRFPLIRLIPVRSGRDGYDGARRIGRRHIRDGGRLDIKRGVGL